MSSGAQNPVRLFTAAMLHHWWALMSCAAFTGLGVYIAATNKGNGWVVGGSAILAAVFFVVAAYKTWRDEHRKYLDEVGKNQRPDIKGEASHFDYHGTRSTQVIDGNKSASSGISFQLFLCNERPPTTTLRDIEIDGSQLTPPVLFDFKLIEIVERDIPFPVGTELPFGIGKNITVHVEMTVAGMDFVEVPPINMDKLKVCVVDAFGQRHPIPVKPGEQLARY